MRKATTDVVMSFCLSVRMEQLSSHWTDFHEIWYLRIFLKNVSRKFKYSLNLIRITGTLHKDLCTFRIFFFLMSQQPLVTRVSSVSRLHYYTQTPHSVLLLWTSDHPDTPTSTWQHASITGDSHPCPLEKFEPATTASKLPQTHVLDRAVTGIRKFGVISRWALHGMRNVTDKRCRENETHSVFSDFLPKIVPFMR